MLRSSISVGLLISLGLSLSACADDGAEASSGSGEFRSLEDGLELHWSFEDRVGNQITDLSGNGRHGTLNGGSFVSSPLGEAVSLDGVDDYVALTHLGLRAPSLYGGVTGDFTISARVRVDDVNKLNTLCFGCGPFSAMYVGTAAYPAKVMTALFNQQTGGSLFPLSSAALVNDEWREVTLVVDGGVSARYYLDCQADTLLSNANLGLKDYNSSSVGRGASADRWFGGEMDQLRVWSRALSESEIAELCPEPPVDDGPLLHWTFEDHSGTQITDLSGNGYHGTLNGGAFVTSPKGEAITLDGVDDYVAFTGPRSPALYGDVNGDFTISARVRVADINKYNTLCYGCGPSSTWYLGDAVHGGRMTAAFLNQSTNGTLWTASTPAMSEDAWTEVTMVVDGGTSVRHYFNCGFDSQTSNANLGLKDYGFSAVGLSGNAARWFGGEIDELRIWDRALPEGELAQLCDCLGPIHVDVDAPDGGDGESWATAFNNLQAALDAGLACNSPEIWVAEGTYAPNPNAPVATITAPVSIYGGFAGTESDRAQRDFVAHPVRLGADAWNARAVIVTDTAIEPGQRVHLDGFTIANSARGAIELEDLIVDTDESLVALHNLTLTGNSAPEGGGILTDGVFGLELVGCHFEGNHSQGSGGAIRIQTGRLEAHDCTFSGNHAVDAGGAIMLPLSEGAAGSEIYDSSFSNNTARGAGAISFRGALRVEGGEFINNVATHFTAGAIHGGDELTLIGVSFVGNTAINNSGAIDIYQAEVTIEGSSFIDNSAHGAGAVQLDEVTGEIRNSRFIGNEATVNTGGALRLFDGDVDVINTEFVGNIATTHGGGVYGRGTFVSSTFANNQAGGSGKGLFAPAGATMTIRNVVAWPDNLAAGSMILDHACIPQVVGTNIGSVFIAADPFAPADLDMDGLTELYLAPGSPCVDIGGTVNEFDWTALTTQSSQCTDAAPVDAGVHYTPLSPVGPC